MKKIDLFLLYLFSLLILSFTLYFQTDPGYMDAEFYYLGANQIINGKLTIPVLWNYLDNPINLPNPIFSYWMPLPSLLTAFSMYLFGTSFITSRIVFLIMAAGLAPITYLLAYRITLNRYSSVIAGSMAIMSGFYLKFMTIPETVLPYIIFGALFFIVTGNILSPTEKNRNELKQVFWLGLLAGILHLSRVDGIFFLFIGLFVVVLGNNNQTSSKFRLTGLRFVVYLLAYLLVMGFWYGMNLSFYQSVFSPATSKALWIATYDDTFIFPASKLSMNYWLENGIHLRPSQIFQAIKVNLGTFLGVQVFIFGLPLLLVGLKRNLNTFIVRVGIIYLLIIFLIMTFIFPLAGSRGGYLHSASAIQVLIWVLIADGLDGFFRWGIRTRKWELRRSQIIFGAAFFIIITIFTILVYKNDVIGNRSDVIKWSQDYKNYEKIEEVILDSSEMKSDVILINNPLGYFYSTGRWSIVLPNSEVDDFKKLVDQFDVRYIVVDQNLPDKFDNTHKKYIEESFTKLREFSSGIEIYEIIKQ